MEIVKDAFVEGRKTHKPWDKSIAKSNQLKLDVALENLSLMQKKENFTPIALHQIDPNTGKVLHTFPSRIAAARYIVKDVLKRPEKDPVAITGNMEMCMRSGWKAYGFYWKIATPASIEEYTRPSGTAKRIFAKRYNEGGVFKSFHEASQTLGISVKVLNRLANPNTEQPRGITVQQYNAVARTLKFDSIKKAASYANVGYSTMARWIKRGKAVNNTHYVVENDKIKKAKRQYRIYQGHNKVSVCYSGKEVATFTGATYKQVLKAVKSNTTLGEFVGEFGQFKIKVVYV